MANVKFPRKEFEKHVKLTPKVIEKISLFGTPLESLNNEEIEIEIFPNRPDLLSMQGFLRSFKAFLGRNPGLKKYKINPPEKNYKVKIEPSVKPIRPYTACAIVKNLSFNDEKIKEIIDLQEKLHNTIGRNRKKVAIGIYPLEKIKLPIRYTALPPDKIKFIPLEEEKEMSAFQVLQKHPTGREYAHLLENKEKYPIFIDAKNSILSMPPIINSHETGKITGNTKEVFIECSGPDFSVLQKALNIIVTTLSEMNGKIYQMELNYGKKSLTPNLTPEKIKISLENANKLLGLNLKEQDMQKLLSKMQYNYSKEKVEIPPWRTDILHEVDIIEDIAIAYGYENIIPQIPSISTIGEEAQEYKIKKKLSEILLGLGFLEISSYHLLKQSEDSSEEKLEIQDSKTEYKSLRQNLLIPHLRILSENKDHEYPQEIFEIGKVFAIDKGNKTETGVKESENLIIALSPGNFTKAKQILDYLTRTLSISYTLQETTKKELIEGRTGEILINNKPIGYLGELHPETLHSWNIKMPLAVIEISLDEILNL